MKAIKNIILYIVICLMLATSAFAVDSDHFTINDTAVEYNDDTRTEQVEWVFMTIDGVRHKRLWSITRGIWLTDWIPCD